MEIGKRIRKVREAKNYTQEYMADQLGVNQSTFSRWENNDTDITITEIKKIADILEINPEELLTFNEKFVLNNYSSNQTNTNQGHVTNLYTSENERKLYEDKIKLLEDKIQMLEKVMELMKIKG